LTGGPQIAGESNPSLAAPRRDHLGVQSKSRLMRREPIERVSLTIAGFDCELR